MQNLMSDEQSSSFSHQSARLPMKFATLLPLLTLLFLASCATPPNEVVADLYSPSKQYHGEVRKCPEVGSIVRGEEVQATVLEAGRATVLSRFAGLGSAVS